MSLFQKIIEGSTNTNDLSNDLGISKARLKDFQVQELLIEPVLAFKKSFQKLKGQETQIATTLEKLGTLPTNKNLLAIQAASEGSYSENMSSLVSYVNTSVEEVKLVGNLYSDLFKVASEMEKEICTFSIIIDQTLSQQEKRKSELRQSLKNNTQKKNLLDSKMNELKQKNEILLNSQNQLKIMMNSLQQIIASTSNQINNKKNEIAAQKSEEQSKIYERNQLFSDLKEETDELERIKQNLRQLNMKKKDYEREIEGYKTQKNKYIDSKNQEIAKLERQQEDARDKQKGVGIMGGLAVLGGILFAPATGGASLLVSGAAYGGTLAGVIAYDNEISKARQEIRENEEYYNKKISSQNDEINRCNSQINKLGREVQRAESRCLNKKEQLKNINEEYNQIIFSIESIKQMIRQNEEKIANYQGEVNKLKINLIRIEEQINENQQETKIMDNEILFLKDEIAKMSNLINETERNIAETHSLKEDLMKLRLSPESVPKLQKIRQHFDKLDNKMKDFSNELKNFSNKNEKYINEFEDCNEIDEEMARQTMNESNINLINGANNVNKLISGIKMLRIMPQEIFMIEN